MEEGCPWNVEHRTFLSSSLTTLSSLTLPFLPFVRLTLLLSSFSFLLRLPVVSPHLRCTVVGRAEAGERKTKIGRQCISGNQFNV